MPGIKYDQSKLRWSLVVWEAFEDAVRVLMRGAEKYNDENWKEVPDAAERYFSALMRHAIQARSEKTDAESGLSHWAHVITNAMFLWWHEKQEAPSEQKQDEKQIPSSTPWVISEYQKMRGEK